MEIGPTGLFDGFLKKFGTTSPQIALVSSTVIVAFGFENVLDVGVWTVTWILTFVVSFLVADLLPRTSRGALTFCLGFLALAAGVGWAVHVQAPGARALILSHPVALTAIAAYVFAQPTAVLLAAYQYAARLRGKPLPASLVAHAESEIWGVDFYREDMTYEVEFSEAGNGRVLIVTKVSYKVTNRRFEKKTYPVTMKYNAAHGRMRVFRINRKIRPVSSPDMSTGMGLRYDLALAPLQTVFVEAEMEETLPIPGWEVFGTHYPTTHFALVLRNGCGPTLRIDVENFTHDAPDLARHGDEDVFTLANGLLPFQGLRVHWSA